MKGFTLIEIIVVIVILAIVTIVTIPFVISGGKMTPSGGISYGINGMAETRCIEGFKFIVGSSGSTQQLLDQNGKGVPCKQ